MSKPLPLRTKFALGIMSNIPRPLSDSSAKAWIQNPHMINRLLSVFDTGPTTELKNLIFNHTPQSNVPDPADEKTASDLAIALLGEINIHDKGMQRALDDADAIAGIMEFLNIPAGIITAGAPKKPVPMRLYNDITIPEHNMCLSWDANGLTFAYTTKKESGSFNPNNKYWCEIKPIQIAARVNAVNINKYGAIKAKPSIIEGRERWDIAANVRGHAGGNYSIMKVDGEHPTAAVFGDGCEISWGHIAYMLLANESSAQIDPDKECFVRVADNDDKHWLMKIKRASNGQHEFLLIERFEFATLPKDAFVILPKK